MMKNVVFLLSKKYLKVESKKVEEYARELAKTLDFKIHIWFKNLWQLSARQQVYAITPILH